MASITTAIDASKPAVLTFVLPEALQADAVSPIHATILLSVGIATACCVNNP